MTFTGPAGVGKTRLAVEAAAHVRDRFEHGACFVDLAPVSDPALVVPAIARALGLAACHGRPSLAELTSGLRDRRLMLVLDTFEQVVDAATSVAALLEACPELKVVVTSRVALHLRWEHALPVPPLALPDRRRRAPAEALIACPAVALFVERARAVRPDAIDCDDCVDAAAEICLQLDGLPLAIELAAVQVKLLPPRAILARLQHGLDLPLTGPRDLPARQQTLRAAIGWSCDLLDRDEQTLFRRLAVFAGGCTPEAASEVCGAVGGLESLLALLDRSLLEPDPSAEDEPRFLMLETTRRYALERLIAAGEAEGLREQHASYYLRLAERAERAPGGADEAAGLGRLASEHRNLRAALDWATAPGHTWPQAAGPSPAGHRPALYAVGIPATERSDPRSASPSVQVHGRSQPEKDGRSSDPLTRREREVAQLIARGLTNGQIARELVIVKGTVANHVEHILDKLGFSSRTQIAAWVAAGGLGADAASGAA